MFTTVRYTDKGAVVSHPSFGDATLAGPILVKWEALKDAGDAFGFSIQDVLGAPLGEPKGYTEAGHPGQAQYFERGMIASRPTGGCFVVYGDIYARYLQLGGITGSLGWPKTDETGGANGSRLSAFDNGTIFWSAATGAKLVRGGILARYEQMGAASSYLGLPISDEQPVTAGGKTLGACSLFTGGGIWWTLALSAHDMPGYVVDYWRQHGGPTGMFGFPTSDLLDIAGTTLMEFEKGLVAFTPAGPLPLFDLDVYLDQFESNFDDIHVEIDIASTNPSQHEHFWVPTNGYSTNPHADHHFRVGLLRLNTEVTVTTTGYGDHTFGDDERLGTFRAVYNAHNIWGIPDQLKQTSTERPATENANSKFQFMTGVAIKTQGIFNSAGERLSLWWPFHNFDTPYLSQHQMAQTFTDVAEDESNFWHPFDNLFYKYVYQRCAAKGTCFGMCLEAIYARVDRSVFAEPIFDNALIGYPAGLAGGDALDSPSEKPADTARFAEPCQLKFGYQLGHPMVDFALGKYLSGGAYDAVAAFRESRDAYGRGDYPILSVTSGGLGSPGHAVMPYHWDDSSKPWRMKVANPNAPASRVPSDDDQQNVVYIDPDHNSYRFVVGLDGKSNPDLYQGGKSGPGMIMSVPFHLLSCEPSTPFWEVVAALAAATVLLLIFAGDDGATTQISDGHGATAFHPAGTRIGGASAVSASVLKIDPVGRPDVAPILLFNPPPDGGRTETYRISHPIPFRKVGDKNPPADLPAASLAYTHTVAAKGEYQWAIKGPGGSTMIAMGGAGGDDVFKIDQIGRPGQSVSLQTGTAKTAQITVCGGRPDKADELRLFALTGVPLGPTHAVTVQLEQAGEHLVVQNGGEDAHVALRIQSGAGQGARSVSKTVTLPARSVVRINPANWSPSAIATAAVTMNALDRIGGVIIKTTSL